MTIRRLLVAAVLLLALAPAARAEIGDLSFVGCTEFTAPFSDLGCTKSPFAKSGMIVFSPDGTRAYTFGQNQLAWHTRAPDGTLTQVGCFGGTTLTHPCGASVNGIGPASRSLAIAPNGNELYALTAGGSGGSTLIHFNLAGDGTPSFGSCIAQAAGAPAFGCTTIVASLQSPGEAVVSADSDDLYVASGGVQWFELDANGTPTFQACHGAAYVGCDGVGAIEDAARELAIRGDDLYVSNRSLMHYDRALSGALTLNSCFNDAPGVQNACTNDLPDYADNSPDGIAITADGTNAYVAYAGNGGFGPGGGIASLIVYDRAPSGTLTLDSCVADLGATSCPASRGLGAAQDVAVSPGGEWVYAAGEALTILQRAPGGALTRIRCIQGRSQGAGCTEGAMGLESFGGALAIPPTGNDLYASTNLALVHFDRVDYVPPPAPNPAPLDETQGTRRVADAPVIPAAPPPSSPATGPAGRSAPSPIVARRLRNEKISRCLLRPGCGKAKKKAKAKKRKARRRNRR